MKKKTVKKHIFQFNAYMVLALLAALLLINVLFVKIYSESVEHEVKNYLEYMKDTDDRLLLRNPAGTDNIGGTPESNGSGKFSYCAMCDWNRAGCGNADFFPENG